MSRTGHPLPRSKEARHNEIPEHLLRDKGRGDDPPPVLQPAADPVTPDGEPYRYGDLGRGPDPIEEDEMSNNISRDEAARELKRHERTAGGRQVGGGPAPSDIDRHGGSSGSGGYGKSGDAQLHQGQQDRTPSGGRSERRLSRSEQFDEQQGGGRSADAVSRGEDELRRDQAEHQDRGQSIAEAEVESDRG